jgi:preprotein translocase subunit SecD
MKAIINSLLAMFLFGIIATGFIGKPQSDYRILIQANDSKISAAQLTQSIEIITKRLKSFSSEKFDISAIPAKKQVQVILNKKWDQKMAENLITQKGAIEFYETYYFKDIIPLLNGDSILLKLFNLNAPKDSSARIWCTTTTEANRMDKYLVSESLSEKCRFSWSDMFEDSNVCLYGLKVENGKGAIASGSDIESFTYGRDSTWQLDYLSFKFKKEAIPLWADITKRNINHAIAVVLDGKVIYAPVVRDEISGGNCQLTGGFTSTQVKYIAAIGANGELPLDFKVVK